MKTNTTQKNNKYTYLLKLKKKTNLSNIPLKNKMINNLMKNGNKKTCEKIFLKSLKIFQKTTFKSYKQIIKLALKNNTAVFSLKKIKKGKKRRRQTIDVPFIPKKNIRITNSIKTILKEILKKKYNFKTFYKNLTHEFWLTARKESDILKKKEDIQEQALKTKKQFGRFKWF